MLVERFLKYVKIETTSDESSISVPSTKTQLEFAKLLGEELKNIGLSNVSVDQYGYVYASLPSNLDRQVSSIGFIAHMDTSPDISGKDVKPQIVENYPGGDIVLNEEKDISLSPDEFPDLNKYIGESLITTDGTTLLGADNKAGIAEIVTAMEYLIKNPQISHGPIQIAFTPDEEIGRGADYFDVEKFKADFAYTIDGGPVGELQYENFNAATGEIVINGTNIHPGTAKNKMVNSLLLAMELNSLLPVNERPEFTEAYEGFYHLVNLNGNVEKAKMVYIIRDHDREEFENKKNLLGEVVKFLNLKYDNVFDLKIVDSYYNMKEKIEPVFHIIEMGKRAMEDLGISPIIRPIRGGTDGSRLSYMGLPCPNIFTGGYNYHGRYEFIPISSMEKAVDVILKVIELNAK